jgi:beta-lactamase class A
MPHGGATPLRSAYAPGAAYRPYTSSRSDQRQRARARSMATGIIILSIAAATLAALIHPVRHDSGAATPRIASSPAVIPAQANSARGSNSALGARSALDASAITATLRSDTTGLQGSYGIAVTDLSTGTTYGINEDLSFRAASLNKMPILIALYQRAGAGSINLDQAVNLSEDDIQHYGTGLIQDQNAPRTYTLRELAAAMIETSDNTAAFVLERLLGQETIQASLGHWSLKHTSMAANTTTPGDTAAFFSSLYRNQLLPSQATDVALTLLEHTVFGDRLVSGVPAGVSVAHKVGSDVGVFNDAGLVLAAGHPYAVAVLSQNADETEAQQAFLRISKDIYRFEMSLPAGSPN